MTTVACITAFCCQVDDPRPALPTPPHALWWPRAVVPLGILPALTGGGHRAFSRWRTRASRAWWPRLPERPRRLRLCSPQPDWPQPCLAPPTGRGVLDTDGLEVRHPGRAGRRPPPRGRQGRSPHRGLVGANGVACCPRGGGEWRGRGPPPRSRRTPGRGAGGPGPRACASGARPLARPPRGSPPSAHGVRAVRGRTAGVWQRGARGGR